MLADALANARRRIAKSKKLNENDTKATLIEPILAALGWDVLDPEEVAREHKAPRAKPVDYALRVMREPKLYVEAKALGEDLANSKVAHQIMGYAAVAGVEWIVVTNGDEWRIYNSHATVPVEQKLLRAVRVSDPAGGAEEILALLAKDQLKTKLIDALWRAHFVDRQVKAAIEGLFNPDKDMTLVNHVRSVATDLTAEDIRSSMLRCKLTIDFPLSPGDIAVANAGGRGREQRKQGFDVSLLELIRNGTLRVPARLVGIYKGQRVLATVRKSGKVEFDGREFDSLSSAGSAALISLGAVRSTGRRPAVNGWDFWQVERPGGTLAPMAKLRTNLNPGPDAPAALG